MIPEDNEDYTEMSISDVNAKKKPNKKEKTRSQPITIQNNHQISSNKHASSPLSSGGSSSSGFFIRKHSSGTPPRLMHLPLTNNTSGGGGGGTTSPYSSLPRQRSRKNSSRRDSKDSSTTSSVVTTPSSSSTLFPMSLNSPSSPSTNNYEIVTINTNASSCSGGSLKIPAAVLNTTYKGGKTNKPFCSSSNNSDDYTMMDFEFNKKVEKKLSNHKISDNSEYVNYSPAEHKCSIKGDADVEKDTKTNTNTGE